MLAGVAIYLKQQHHNEQEIRLTMDLINVKQLQSSILFARL